MAAKKYVYFGILLHPMLDAKAKVERVARGLPASPGAAVGKAVFTADEAEAWAARGEGDSGPSRNLSLRTVGGMHAAQGILTGRRG